MGYNWEHPDITCTRYYATRSHFSVEIGDRDVADQLAHELKMLTENRDMAVYPAIRALYLSLIHPQREQKEYSSE